MISAMTCVIGYLISNAWSFDDGEEESYEADRDDGNGNSEDDRDDYNKFTGYWV